MKVIYNDPRRFGFFQFIKNNKDLKKRFNHLGPEPFDKKFNIKYVLAFFREKNKVIYKRKSRNHTLLNCRKGIKSNLFT